MWKIIWKDIVGYEGVYQVSNIGDVRSLDRVIVSSTGNFYKLKGKVLKKLNGGYNRNYLIVILSKGSVSKNFLIHRLVAKAFIPNPENKPDVNHIGKDKNGVINPKDNRVISLEWATKKENTKHAWSNGLMENTRKSSSKTFIKMNSKLVININTGVFYDSLKEAAETISVNYNTLRSQVNGSNPNKSPFRYA